MGIPAVCPNNLYICISRSGVMEESPIKKILKLFMKIILATVIIAIIVSVIFAMESESDFTTAFSYAMFLSGVLIMGIGALVGGGGSEKSIQGAATMYGTHHSNYYEKMRTERSGRRDSQFIFMVLMAIAGCIMIGIGAAITYL